MGTPTTHEGEAQAGEMLRAMASPTLSDPFLRAALAGVPHYIVTVDRQLRITFVNRYLPGLVPETFIGRSYVDFCRPEIKELAGGVLRDALASGETRSYEARSLDGFGAMIFRVTATPMVVDQAIVGLTLVAEDVSRQKEIETRLLRSDLLANLGTLVAGIAHEVNNPLTYLLGNLEYLLLDPTADVERRVRDALEGAERIRTTVADLMSLLRDRPEPATAQVVLDEVVQRALRVVRREITMRARLEHDVDAALTVRGSAGRIGQVLLNLLINAAHAIEDGRPADNLVRVQASVLPEGFVRVSVSDSGCGIERSLIGRIFDPFVTTRAGGEGTGLGLYVCHSIVDSLGGRIWVDSEVGKGSTFHLDLPAGLPPAQQVPQHAAEPRRVAPDSLGVSVLVVEDEPSIREFARSVLGRDHAASAGTVREALELMSTCHFDLVVCDLGLPDASGLDLFERVSARPDCPAFVFASGGPVGTHALARLEASGWPLVPKPFTAAELLGAVRSVAARAR
jgi:signal transduction histidine kinase